MTSTALDINHHQAGPATALAIQPGQIAWDTMQLAALDQLGLKDAGDGDRAVFLHVCQRTGLDPFARQIHMIPRREKIPGTQNSWRNKWTIQTGIDGFRVNRDRAERKAGVRGKLGRALFYGPDGNKHKVWVQPRPPVACEITYTVKDRHGNKAPYISVLRFTEYCQTDSEGNLIAQWRTKPAHMLEKCTEADVYRKAFPQDFSGISLDDETVPPQDTPPADGTPGGRPRGRVTVGEVIGREHAGDDDASGQEPKTPARTTRRKTAAGDDTRSRTRSAGNPAPAQDGTTGERTARDAPPRAAGAAPSRGAQPLPPPPGEDDETPAAGVPDETPASGPALAAGLEPGEAAEYGTERHRKLIGIVWGHLGRLGYPRKDKETDEEKTRRLADTARLAGVNEIGSTSDLDLGELSAVIDTLARCKNAEALQALLNAGETGD